MEITDQANIQATQKFGTSYRSRTGQTFQPGFTGQLSAVEICLYYPCNVEYKLSILDSDNFEGNILATGRFVYKNQSKPLKIQIPQKPILTKDKTYILVLESTDSRVHYICPWITDQSNYSRGNLIDNTEDGKGYPVENLDLCFRTHMIKQ